MLRAAALAAGVTVLTIVMPSPNDKVAFLNVGQGDAILLQNQTVQVLIDGGPDATVLQRLAEEMPWFDQRIEVMVATHPDQDHLAGLVHVLNKYQVDLVILPWQAHDSGLQRTWLEMLVAKEVPFRFAAVGQTIKAGEMSLEILYPEAGQLSGDNNDNSVVIRADYHGTGWLLTGDATVTAEKKMLAMEKNKLNVEVLKVGHHGSKSSTSADLVQAVTPGAAVISVGKDNRYGHPASETLRRLDGIGLLRTDENGTVRWLWADEQWQLACEEGCFTKSG